MDLRCVLSRDSRGTVHASARALVGGFVAVALTWAAPVAAQSMEDAIFMDRRVLCAGLLYTRDQWSNYWEGGLKRDNGNVGTVTTQAAAWMGAYGVTDKLNIIASLPYVWTNASQGVLGGQRGAQDLTVGVKYRAFRTPLTSAGSLSGIVGLSASAPTSDYTPDFLPLSIGSSSKRVTARGTLSYEGRNGVYVNGSAAYTRRGNVTLDRVAYYTQNQLFLTNEVAMPDVSEAALTVGYQRKGLVIPVVITRQTTLGGGDIRRQDMPFVSNRMNFTRVDTRVQYVLPKLRAVTVHAGVSQIIAGRNVGQGTTLMGGLLLVGKL